MIASTPAPIVQAAAHHGLLTGRFNLDPHGVCPRFDYSTVNAEPDMGEAGGDVCSTPDRVTVVVRMFRHGRQVTTVRLRPRVRDHRGSFSVRAKGDRFDVTLVNPWGSNRHATGVTR